MGGRERSGPGLRWMLWIVLAATVLLAGCMGGSEDAEALNETDVDDAQAAAAAEDGQPADEARLGFAAPDDIEHLSESGSFGAADGSFAGGFLRGADTREHDLTPQVPVQAPVTVNVTINYTGETSQLNAYWLFEDVHVVDQHYVKNFETNTIWMEALVARSSNAGTVTAIVQADTAGEAPEREYTLDARLRSHGEATLPRVPTTVPVTETSEGFELEPVGDGELSEVLVWGPEGGFQSLDVQAGSASLTIDADDPVGDYVVFARPAEPAETVPRTPIAVRAANASQVPSQPLEIPGMELSVGEWHETMPGEPANWTFDRETPPLQAGIQARPTTPFAVTGGPDGGLQVALRSPAGTVVEGSAGFLFITSGTFTWMSPVGDEALVPGTYEAQATTSLSTSYEATHVVLELAR